MLKIQHSLLVAPPSNPCKPGVPLVQCFAEPCAVNSCPRYPNAECRDDYCGGCNARYYVDNREVTRFCQGNEVTTTTNKPISCKPGVPVFQCFVRPCSVATCQNYRSAVCRNDYCGGCKARFFLGVYDITEYCG